MRRIDPLVPPALDEVIAIRRDLHRHPELGYQEHRTAGIVAARLRELGYSVHTGIAETGVVGVLNGSEAGLTVMLRADMDALPLREETGLAFSSSRDGTMHACGHDGHVAILLGAARAIAERQADLAGNIVLCFQPAEEGQGGAKRMVEEGLIERFRIDRAYGFHLSSDMPTGVLGFCEGPACASHDAFEIRIDGFGGHAATPHLSIDPIFLAGEFVTLVQNVVSRQIDPLEPAVVTLGSISGGTTHNVIPSSVTLLGTVRAFDSGVREKMAERIERVLRCVCESSGAKYSFSYKSQYPVMTNDVLQTRYARSLAAQVVGDARAVAAAQELGSEDFAFFAERMPATYFTLGSAGGDRTSFPHHHAKFDIDEAALRTGVEMVTALALDAPLNAP